LSEISFSGRRRTQALLIKIKVLVSFRVGSVPAKYFHHWTKNQ
jgi:hypothetical protein